jgi:hypothetical protein
MQANGNQEGSYWRNKPAASYGYASHSGLRSDELMVSIDQCLLNEE